ncbi:MAG: DegT/DnrJ/EryC1/StrS family aminotransferase [Archaeoglobaceae archaeon]
MKPVPPDYPGAVMFDEMELSEVRDVIENKSPFRFYGPKMKWKTRLFEERFAQYIGTKYCLAVSSGTAALVVALKALGVGPGDEVLVPAITFIATAGAVLECGAKPIFVEVDESLTMDVSDAANKVTEKTRTILPVHFAGVACNMEGILEISKKYSITIVEDCAQACGASYKGKKVGSLGLLGTFSFQINKIITTGDGGAVTSNDHRLYLRAVRAHDHGCLRDENGALGIETSDEGFFSSQYRMNELSAAVGLAQLSKIEKIIHNMRQNKRKLVQNLQDLKNFKLAKVHDEDGDSGRNLVLISKSIAKAMELIGELKKLGFAASLPYGGNTVYAHSQIKYGRRWDGKELYSRVKKCKFSEDLAKRSVIVGISPLFEEEHLATLTNTVRKVDKSRI